MLDSFTRIEPFVEFVRENRPIELTEGVRKNVQAGREALESLLKQGRIVYGVNTGFGGLAVTKIPKAQLRELQMNLLRSHACGTGNPLSPDVVRGTMCLQIHSLAKGYSAISYPTLEAFVKMYNAQIVPCVPEAGSLGASGDLAPLAHIALVLCGEGAAWQGTSLIPGKDALAAAHLQPIILEAKEGLSLINGTYASTAVAAFATYHAQTLLKAAMIANALTMEALRGNQDSLKYALLSLKYSPGTLRSADYLLRLLKGSTAITEGVDPAKVQDPYSLRCSPQSFGASEDSLFHLTQVVDQELNAVSDNPVLIKDKMYFGGNFNAFHLAEAMDALAISLTNRGVSSESRLRRLLHPRLSGLPAFLTPQPGLNSGMMILQNTANDLLNECRILSTPASVQPATTSADQEDHVSMAMTAARKGARVCDNAERIIAAELLAACQALEFQTQGRLGRGTQRAYEIIRMHVPPLQADRELHADLTRVYTIVHDGFLIRETEAALEKALAVTP